MFSWDFTSCYGSDSMLWQWLRVEPSQRRLIFTKWKVSLHLTRLFLAQSKNGRAAQPTLLYCSGVLKVEADDGLGSEGVNEWN